jgi:hypothetical protein
VVQLFGVATTVYRSSIAKATPQAAVRQRRQSGWNGQSECPPAAAPDVHGGLLVLDGTGGLLI